MASCCMPGRSSMALFTRTAKLDPGAHGARCAWDMAVHHAVGISRHRSSGYRPSRVNIMAQGLSTPEISLNPTHLSIWRGRATTTHCTHHQVSLVVSRNTTLVPSLGLHIGPACEAGLSAGMRSRACAIPNKKERKMPSVLNTGKKILSVPNWCTKSTKNDQEWSGWCNVTNGVPNVKCTKVLFWPTLKLWLKYVMLTGSVNKFFLKIQKTTPGLIGWKQVSETISVCKASHRQQATGHVGLNQTRSLLSLYIIRK